jgi:uncharacterized protein (TIGR02246 family)
MRTHRIVLGLLLTLSVAAFAAAAERAGDQAAIRGALERFAKAWNAGDAAALAALFDEQGSFTRAGGVTLHGRDEIEKGLGEGFEGPFKGARLRITAEHVHFLTEDVAIQDEAWAIINLRDSFGNDLPPMHGLSLVVWVKRDGKWLVAASQGMVPVRLGNPLAKR